MIDTKATLIHYWFQGTAIMLAWIGGIIGACAAFYSWNATGQFATVTFVASILTLLATIPVYLQRQQTGEVIKASRRSGIE